MKSQTKKVVIQLLVRTNISHLNDVEEPALLWMDTTYGNLATAQAAWPQETHRKVLVTS